QQPDMLARCTTLVVDEVQTLSDGERGARLEALLTQVKLVENPPQIIALSASLDDVNKLDVWLTATLVLSTERPIPLTQSVCTPSGTAVVLEPDGTLRTKFFTRPQVDREDLVVALVQDFLTKGQQVLVFRSTIRAVVDTAHRLRARL